MVTSEVQEKELGMLQKTAVAAASAALLFGASVGASQATTLQTLIAGATLTEGPVTFSAFSFTDVGGSFGDYAVPASSIAVSTSTSSNIASLSFALNAALATDEVLEIFGEFTANIAGGGVLNSVSLELENAAAGGGLSFIELGSNNLGGISTTVTESDLAPQSVVSATLPAATTRQLIEWDVSGEADFRLNGFAGISMFSIKVDYTSGAVTATVPLPASLPLLLAGVGGLAILRRRKSRVCSPL